MIGTGYHVINPITLVVNNLVGIASSLDFKSKSEPKTFLSLRCGLQVAANDDDVLIKRSEYDDVLIERSEYDDDVLIERSEYDDDDILIERSEYDDDDVLIERSEYDDDVSD